MTTIERIQQDLPNFPEEVIHDWIQPYAKTEGWPPQLGDDGIPMGRWRYLLGLRPMAKIQALTWQVEDRALDVADLAAGEEGKIVGLLRAAILKEQNIYSEIGNSEERMVRIIQHVKETGRLPSAPTLISKADGLQIVDGNHRIAVYFFLTGRAASGVPNAIPIDPQQRYWIGRPGS